MQKPKTAFFSLFACLLAAPLVAQPTIGGGACSSSTISGTYAVMLIGRGVALTTVTTALTDSTGSAKSVSNPTAAVVAGTLANVFQAVGYATFDGLSKATFVLTADSNTVTHTSLNWSGTYSVQSNCGGTVTITTGGSATLNLSLSAGGAAFSLSGSDTTYTYAGNGNTQATACSTSTMSGVYALTASQGFYALTNGSAGGAGAFSGLIQFDGLGNLIVNATISANGLQKGATETQPGFTFTGTYSMGSDCVGSATISNTQAGTFEVNLSVYTANSTGTISTQMYLSMATNPPSAMVTGNAYWIYATEQTATPGAALHHGVRGFGDMLVKLVSGKLHKGERA